MPTIEFLEKRVSGREREIEKLEKKIGRIKAAEATGWKENPYLYSESDLRCALRDLKEAEEALKKYRSQLIAEQEKSESRNIPAILKFLDQWKSRVREFYGKGLMALYAELEAIQKLQQMCFVNPALQETLQDRRTAYSEKVRGKFERQTYTVCGKPRTRTVKVVEGEWEHLVPYMKGSYEKSMEHLQKELDKEAVRKYDALVERVTSITGPITDASHLAVGAKGELNGYVTGTRGRVKVKTIGAGGYHIQCYHYRTIVTRV